MSTRARVPASVQRVTEVGFGGGVYLVTDTAMCGPRGVVETVRAAVAAGVGTVQVRDKTATAVELFDLVVRTAEAVGERALVLVDDRVDVYLAARAAGAPVHGVHVGQSDLPVRAVRELVGHAAVVGLTANTAGHLVDVRGLPAGTVDYLGVGVIRPTLTKPNHPEPLGVSGFRRFAEHSPLPCIAIGGVGHGDLAELRAAGAAGAAVVSAICASGDPAGAAARLVAEWR